MVTLPFDPYLPSFFEQIIFESSGKECQVLDLELLPGGFSSQSLKVVTDEGIVFVKYDENAVPGLFESEAKNLEFIRNTKLFRVPEVIGSGLRGSTGYLLLEYIEPWPKAITSMAPFAEALAQLHLISNHSFGFEYDNFLGKQAQQNPLMSSGIRFFAECRLLPQAGLAYWDEKLPLDVYKSVISIAENLENYLPQEQPALLHGDLWYGNLLAYSKNGIALVDPACYFGLREAEIAFTHLFGGFGLEFYETYQEVFPLEPGFRTRMPIYNLYHLLNHLNNFGTNYLGPVKEVVSKFR